MARRKNGFLSDGSDSGDSDLAGSDDGYNSQEDGDSRAERALFEYNGSKRRKMGGGRGKEAAWEGIFGEDEDVDRSGGRGLGSKRAGGRGGRNGIGARSDVTNGPPKTAIEEAPEQPDDAGDNDEEMDEVEDEDGDSDSDDDDDSTPAASPRIRDEEDDAPKVGMGGRNFRPGGPSTAGPDDEDADDAEDPGPSRKKGSKLGIGAKAQPKPAPTTDDRPSAPDSLSATPEPDRQRSAFPGRAPPPAAAAPPRFARPAALTAQDAAHLNSVSNSFGAKFLKNFGWNAGEGLGKDKSGRAVPIAVGKHMKGQGISKGVRTEDSKREARRRGELVSDDEDEERPNRRGKAAAAGNKARAVKGPDTSWKKQRKVKVKVEHKTYEQLLAEGGESTSGVGLVLDARGGELREVESLSALDLSGWTPTGDNAQLPELRHNLRLVVDVTKGDVEALVKEGRSVNEKKRWATREEQVARAKLDDGAKPRLEEVLSRVAQIQSVAATEALQPSPSLAPLAEWFDDLLQRYKEEYNKLDLDDVVVGAIGQVMRTAFAEWQPFDVSSDVLLSNLKAWKHAYRLPTSEDQVNRDQGRGMTAWESLLWALWLPKVRAAINNEWSANSPQPAVHLLESWDSLLPSFIRDNILDQLILPKVKQAMEDWDGRVGRSGKPRSLSGIVFPWLPLLGHRMDDILDGAKRRIRSVMRKWVVRDGVPEELARWKKDIFTSKEWDDLMLRNVVPKLGVSLRDDFAINPRKQDMVPLEEWVLPWNRLLRSSVFSQLLEVNFFPKWLDILYIWLVQPNFKADEVATWFTWWKGRFPDNVVAMPGVAAGFTAGLQLMQDAMQLGPDAPNKLRKAVYDPPKTSSSKSTKPAKNSAPIRRAEVAAPTEITFRSLAEDIAAQNDLVFFPVGRSHDLTGKPLFKVSKSADGRGGVMVYVGEDAVFAQGADGQYRAVSLDDMVKRALA